MTVRVERDGRLARILLDRPPLNILDLATIDQLGRAIAGLEESEAPQLTVLRSAIGRAFSAGVAVEDHQADRIGPTLEAFHGVIRRLWRSPSIFLAVVEGHCLGGGMELALACDLVLATEDSTFGQPEIHLGCYPPVAAALYPSLIGRPKSLELLLTGRKFTALEAEELGLVNWRVGGEEIENSLEAIVADLLGRSAAVTRWTKRAVGPSVEEIDRRLAEAERLYLEELTRTEDMHEGIAAFLEKRPPDWNHR